MPSVLQWCVTGVIGLVLTMPAPAAAAETAPSLDAEGPALTLKECYALALKRSEQLAINQELIVETEARFLQSLSGALPRVSYAYSYKRQDATGDSAFKLRNVPESKFVFSQPLFSGFKEFAAMAGSKAERRERIAEKARAEQLLLVDVRDAFYMLREQRHDLQALETIRLALMERLDALKERERLGRSRPSEVASAEAQLRRIEAESKRVQGQETTARALLEFLTGLNHLEAIGDSEPTLPVVASEEAYLTSASIRPDVRALEEAWQVAKNQVDIARAKFYPTVGGDGNYYTQRGGASEGVSWDVTLKVDVPLFQGGQAYGAVKEAGAKAREAKWRLANAQRSAALDIRDAYAKLQAALERSIALEQAQDAAETSYRLQVEDYSRNLVSNLDVLQALQVLGDARRDVIHAQHDAKRLYWHLMAATGATL